VPSGGIATFLASEKQARQGRRERPYRIEIWARLPGSPESASALSGVGLRTQHGAALQPSGTWMRSPEGTLLIPQVALADRLVAAQLVARPREHHAADLEHVRAPGDREGNSGVL